MRRRAGQLAAGEAVGEPIELQPPHWPCARCRRPARRRRVTKSGSSSASNSAPLPIAATGPIRSWQRRAASSSTTRRSTRSSGMLHADRRQRPHSRLSSSEQQRRGAVEILGPVGIEERVDRRPAHAWSRNGTVASGSARSSHRPCARPPRRARGADRRAAAPATSPITGCGCPAEAAQASSAPAASMPCKQAADTRSSGRNGASVGDADDQRAIGPVCRRPSRARPECRRAARRSRGCCRRRPAGRTGRSARDRHWR